MKIRILGCGGSFGSPLAWNRNGNIDIKNKKNIRTRSSLLINLNNHNILIDTSPDLRNQLYEAKCTNIDSVIFTHLHSDHTAGLPDMRSMSLINDKIIPAYMPSSMIDSILTHYKFIINGTKINTFKHNHGSIDVQTYRINNFAYSTDLKKFYNNDIDKLKNLDLWIVGLLREDSHPSHAGFDQIMEYIDYIKPKKTILTHMTALLDYDKLLKKCPKNVFPAYDGMEINL